MSRMLTAIFSYINLFDLCDAPPYIFLDRTELIKIRLHSHDRALSFLSNSYLFENRISDPYRLRNKPRIFGWRTSDFRLITISIVWFNILYTMPHCLLEFGSTCTVLSLIFLLFIFTNTSLKIEYLIHIVSCRNKPGIFGWRTSYFRLISSVWCSKRSLLYPVCSNSANSDPPAQSWSYISVFHQYFFQIENHCWIIL